MSKVVSPLTVVQVSEREMQRSRMEMMERWMGRACDKRVSWVQDPENCTRTNLLA